MIELECLSRVFRLGDEEVHALEDVTETIRAGEHVAIMGPSGSGKSTLLHLIGCLDRPTAGSYRFEGREVSDLSERELDSLRQHRFGFVFQAFHLVARLTARQNVELPLVFAGVEPGARRRRSQEVLEAVGLAHRARHRPSELSGGERQRIAIARALSLSPSVLLADEPTGNLDRRSGDSVLDLLDQLHAGGLTVLVVTHDPRVARRAERVLLMEDGRIARRVGRDGLAEALAHWGIEDPA
ncbi:MAG: ABC transporter ATP-binding protein [Thermoanaerobaculia bacterium]|nr:MAG: ABC transporter ATP-binding protein [Thermoanaerobaculia bacterium]